MLKNYKEYHLIGHSFGALIAINLASIFEKSGKKGRVTVIDGSPEMFETILKNQRLGHDELQDFVLCYIVSIFYQNVERSKFSCFLLEKTWEAKCNKTVELILELGYQYSKEDLYHCLNACYSRAMIMSGIPKGSLGFIRNSKCLFIRPTEETLKHENETYDMKDYFEQNVDVTHIEGNHQSIISNLQMVKILNQIHDE